MSRWRTSIFLFLLTLTPAAAGRAQEAPEDAEARNLFQAGQNAFVNGNFARATGYFEQAYALSHRSGLLYNIAFAADRLGDERRALDTYRAYLAAEPETERREEVQARIAYLEAMVPVAEPEPEAEPEAQPTTPDPIELEPPASAGGGLNPAGVVTLVGAGMLLGSFGIFAGLSEVEDQALAARCGRDARATCADSAVRNLETLNAIADISLVVGAVAAVTGLVLILALPAEQSRSLAFAPWIAPEGAGFVGVGTW